MTVSPGRNAHRGTGLLCIHYCRALRHPEKARNTPLPVLQEEAENLAKTCRRPVSDPISSLVNNNCNNGFELLESLLAG
jgi:hypothetical protein